MDQLFGRAVEFDEGLPSFSIPASDHEVYMVGGSLVGRFVEMSLCRVRRERHRSGLEELVPVELLALKRFRRGEIAEYSSYAGHLEDTARIAARGQLGYTVEVTADDGTVKLCLVARLLDVDGFVHTDISHEWLFREPGSHAALVRANEKAVELRELAGALNEQWASVRAANLASRRAVYEQVDADARAAEELKGIIDSEKD